MNEKYQLNLPLPGKAGLTEVSVKKEDTLAAFVSHLKWTDASINTVVASDEDRLPFADSTLMQHLSDVQSFNLKINDTEIGVFSVQGAAAHGGSDDKIIQENLEGFSAVKSALQTDPRNKLPLSELDGMFKAHGCGDDATREAWLRRLHELDLILHFGESNDTDLRERLAFILFQTIISMVP